MPVPEARSEQEQAQSDEVCFLLSCRMMFAMLREVCLLKEPNLSLLARLVERLNAKLIFLRAEAAFQRISFCIGLWPLSPPAV